LALAVTFCLYGFIRKKASVDAVPGFFVEALVISVPAGFYILHGAYAGTGHFLVSGWQDTLLLLGLGPFTAAPLLFYSSSVRRIRYSTAGILQYMSPSLVFLTAVFVFHEPMSPLRFASFALLWLALAIYSVSAIREDKARRAALTSSAAQA
jgi:chloramphenicol-sensitive protein RarD